MVHGEMVHGEMVHGEMVHGGVVDHGMVDGGVIVDESSYGTIVDDGTVIQDGGMVIQDGGTVVDGSTVVDDGTVVGDYSNEIQNIPPDNREPTYADPRLEPSTVEPAAGDFYTDDMSPIPQPATNDADNDIADDLGDDLFGQDADPVAADPVAADSVRQDDVDLDDLFDDGGTTTAPPTAPVQPEPTGDGVDDDLDALFDTPDTGGGGGDFEAAPSTDDDLDSLFDDEGGTGEDDLDSLFDSDQEARDDMDTELEELFGEDVNDDLDALMGEKDSSQPAQEEEVTHTVSFVDSAMPFRTWWDDTGAYQTVGRLLIIEERQVRLLKSNGRTCTVGFDRLSDEDLEYIQQEVEQYQESLKVAAR